jgi:hypothetical protein
VRGTLRKRSAAHPIPPVLGRFDTGARIPNAPFRCRDACRVASSAARHFLDLLLSEAVSRKTENGPTAVENNPTRLGPPLFLRLGPVLRPIPANRGRGIGVGGPSLPQFLPGIQEMGPAAAAP